MIKKIEEKDLVICARLLQAAYSCPPYNESFVGDNAYKYVVEKYNSCKNSSFTFLDDNLEIQGFIFLRISTWSHWPQAILEEIVVNPLKQNIGIGKELMKYSYNYLDSLGVKSSMLWVKNDERLLSFYKKQGFDIANDFLLMFKNNK